MHQIVGNMSDITEKVSASGPGSETVRPASIFNAGATPSQDVLLRIAAFIAGGGQIGIGGFGTFSRDEKERADEKTADEFMSSIIQMATDQQVDELRTRLQRLDEASTAALLESEEEMRKARADLQRVRDHAFLLTQPDGSQVRVYRDGNAVRDESGAVIASMKASDLPASVPALSAFNTATDRYAAASVKYTALAEYHARIGKAENRLDEGNVSEEEYARLSKSLGDVPPAVQKHLDTSSAEPVSKVAAKTDHALPGEGLKTGVNPLSSFAVAASGTAKPEPDAPATPAPDLKSLMAASPLAAK